MTERARVMFEPDSLERSAYGGVMGKLWIEIDGMSFPDEGWFDFVLVILAWWLEALSTLPNEDKVVLSFMDGPYFIRAFVEGQNELSLELLRGRGDGREESQASHTVDMRSFVETVNQAARAVVLECRRRGWVSRDLDSLLMLAKNA